MTNYDHFVNLTSGLGAPKKFLDVAFYFAVSAALERRVWFGDIQRRLSVNQFILLVGPPGVGKGLALREAGRLLQAYPLRDENGVDVIDPTTHKTRPLFYQMPDATTFEQLCHEVAASQLTYLKPDKTQESHCSTYFLLEELSSLLRLKKSEDIGRLLLNMYDGTPFKYKIIRTGGNAVIDNGCMNFIAGTTVDFINKAEESGMLGEGLCSRFLIVHETAPRFVRFGIPKLTADQTASQVHLQKWLFCLSRVHGEATISADSQTQLQSWWETEFAHLAGYQDDKLQNFFSRRQVQVTKLAVAMHFAESLEMTIPIEAFVRAAAFCRELENDIVTIARRSGRNSQFPIQERLVREIERNPGRSMAEMITFLAPEMNMADIADTILMLERAERIKQVNDKWYKFSHATPSIILMPRQSAATVGEEIVQNLLAGNRTTPTKLDV